jgi:hypothetical protein
VAKRALLRGRAVMKKIVFLLIILTLTATGCSSIQGYPDKLKDTQHIIEFDSQLSVIMLNTYLKLWSNTAANGLNYDEEVARVRDKAKESLDLLQRDKIEVDKMMRKLSNPPSKYSSAYEKLEECYGVYAQLYTMTFAPGGTPPPDIKAISELQDKLKKSSDEFKSLMVHSTAP